MKAPPTLLGGLLALAACKDNSTPAPTLAKATAGFTLPATAEATVSAAFQNTSQNAATYKWSFGDGSTSTTTAPTHTYAKEGAYTVTLRAYGANQDSATVSQPLTVGAYDVLAHASAKIAGTYDYVMIKNESRPYTGTTTSSQGALTVTRTSASSVTVVTPDFTYLASYRPNPVYPAFYFFEYVSPPNLTSVATFYPTGDSMHFEVREHLSASSNTTYTYRGRRRP